MLILIATVFNLGNPLLPIHLLWVNLVTDSLPALAISLDPPAEGIMKRPPIDSEKGFFTRGFIWRMCYQGLIIGLLALTGYLIGKNDGGVELGQTMAFIVICMAQMLNIRNLHSSTLPSWHTSPFKNMPQGRVNPPLTSLCEGLSTQAYGQSPRFYRAQCTFRCLQMIFVTVGEKQTKVRPTEVRTE